ncbi:retrovirus-related pol polyprotein from transposon tnt 1-94 [Lasius niger]|uniref:Retrovirus-related pol polyprotein from transposon tnt 1-94 n=1 Tax=Lasius niger TaxID=67767 RepID=A0A0J7KJ42_LASNI|nr:retrovirus-related pol polyprotein from transposon tnt 1-94 [Lasius niger]
MIELDEPDESNAEAEPENAGEINAENQGNWIQNEGYQLRDRTTLRLPARYQGDLLLAEIEKLLSYREAIQSEEAANWKKAMNEEYKSLTQNYAWELMEAPKNSTIIDCKWTYKLKRDANGNIQWYKARLVARGFRQQAGIDYQETHSPVVRFDSIRAVLPVASYMKIRQFDVKTAFLYGDIEETIYMQQPEGYEDKTGRICRLRRSLYELKQSSRCWNKCFTEFLQRFNLKATQADSCIFISQNQKQKLILAIYIDDGLIVAQDQISINKLLSELEAKFEITHHNTNMFLGIHIERETDGSIFLHQEAYAKRVLQRFKMEEANPVAIPADPHQKLCPAQAGDESDVTTAPYREAVGSLMYLSVETRYHICRSSGQPTLGKTPNNPLESCKTNTKIFKRNNQPRTQV